MRGHTKVNAETKEKVVSENFQSLGEKVKGTVARLQEWVRRLMPRVAIVGGVLFVARLFFGHTVLFGENVVGVGLGLLTFFSIFFSVIYYGAKGLHWMKRHLLWRVRRRLIITYLFVGLTPVILLTMFGFFSAMGVTSQALGRIAAVEINATEKLALENARALAEAMLNLRANASAPEVQTWLHEQAALLQASLPGARLAVWHESGNGGDVDEARRAAELARARYVSEPARNDEGARGVGNDTTPVSEPLPAWLREQTEWSGLTHILPPTGAEEIFSTPSVRALARRSGRGQSVTLLLVVPVSRVLVERWRESSDLRIRPFFIGTEDETPEREAAKAAEPDPNPPLNDQQKENAIIFHAGPDGKKMSLDFSQDQFGEALPSRLLVHTWYPVFLPATNWQTGLRADRWAFMVDWSWNAASRQLWDGSELGSVWRWGLMYVALAFLFLELLALLSAAWITRAVTGAVHKLYQATQFVQRGDFSHRIRIHSHDQLGELAAAFNDMSSNIESLLQERVQRERLEREIEIAAEVQAQLFPRSVPQLATVEIAGECRAARGVAGDYYDYIKVAPGLVAFALGDVSGKGISASLVMSNLQASLRAQTTIIAERLKMTERVGLIATPATNNVAINSNVLTDERGFARPCGVTGVDTSCAVSNMVESINEQLVQSTDDNRFATLFLALYQDDTRQLRYTNAGHNDALLVRADGSLERLSTGGTMVGAFDWSNYQEGQTELAPGDLLLIFSDGMSEAQNARDEEYGETRLAEFARTHRDLAADELCRRIFDEIDEWSGEQERGDDQTLVIVKSRPQPR